MKTILNFVDALRGKRYDYTKIKDYDPSIKPEDYTWEVTSKTEPAPPIEEDFNPWTDREYAL